MNAKGIRAATASARAVALISAYRNPFTSSDAEVIADIIADLVLYADSVGLDPNDLVANAMGHFAHERDDA
ncbi:hypothetical protein BIV57_13330 [Mangrovactinospora gilvigrisea]|uniref:Uncharacterized protein n=1 Tax=Mangrovactinospora gilvigrisea TaxID=1428644 RepID=A0A1J7CBF8_9ACTN|nr:hypothetical protein [Mangrovactinospora gilvigrisea]OIV36970.1 hypothetical protein BIV57_13330 [Mangrovactinospora gilvigrisea]